jgi:hypothetical protein
MESYEKWTLIIATWGAVISTVLAILKIIDQKKKIKIYLSFIEFEEAYKITVVNTSLKPFEVIDICLGINWQKKGEYDPIPSNARFTEVVDFPLILEAGHSISYYLNPNYFDDLLRGSFLSIEVFDSEGNSYNKYTKNYHNIKYGSMRSQKQVSKSRIKAKIMAKLHKILGKDAHS